MVRGFALLLLMFLIIAISGCGGGGGSSSGGGNSAITTTPINLSFNLIDHPYSGADLAPNPAVEASVEAALNSSGKMGILIWDISYSCPESQSCDVPAKNSAARAALGMSEAMRVDALSLPYQIGYVWTDGYNTFKFMGGAFVDYSAHSATVQAIPGNGYVFSFAMLPDASGDWEPVYVGVASVEVSATATKEKSVTLYEGNSPSPMLLSSLGLDPYTTWDAVMNPGTVGILPSITSLWVENPATGSQTFNVGDSIVGKIELTHPVTIAPGYYYWVVVNITKQGSSTTVSKTIYLRPDPHYLSLIAYDGATGTTPITDFQLNSWRDGGQFMPTSTYGGYFNSNGTLSTSGTFNFTFAFYSSVDSGASSHTKQVIVGTGESQQPIVPIDGESHTFNAHGQAWFPQNNDHPCGFVAMETIGPHWGFVYSENDYIYFNTMNDNPGRGIDLGTALPGTLPTLLSIYESDGTSSYIVPAAGHYYAFLPYGTFTYYPQSTAPIFYVESFSSSVVVFQMVTLPGEGTPYEMLPLAAYPIVDTMQQPTGITYDPVDGKVWIVDRLSREVRKWDPDVGFTAAINTSSWLTYTWAMGLAYDTSTSTLWVSIQDIGYQRLCNFCPITGELLRTIDLSSSGLNIVTPRGLAYNPENNSLMVVDGQSYAVWSINLSGTAAKTELFSTPGSNPWGIFYDGVFYWINDYYNDEIYKLDSDGQVQDQFSSPSAGTSPEPHDMTGLYGLGHTGIGYLLLLDSPSTLISTVHVLGPSFVQE
ncbi:MAG: hypothetical protein PHQ23_06180 [Candidatus Wallbacteria bacterium]|nr:hypothetical protein [Candidatus Wallbacteria bacterium]